MRITKKYHKIVALSFWED